MTVYLYYLIWHLCVNEIFVRRSSWTDILLCMLLIVALNFPPRLLEPPELEMKTTVYCSSHRPETQRRRGNIVINQVNPDGLSWLSLTTSILLVKAATSKNHIQDHTHLCVCVYSLQTEYKNIHFTSRVRTSQLERPVWGLRLLRLELDRVRLWLGSGVSWAG